MSNATCRICGKKIYALSWEDKLCYSCRKEKYARELKQQIQFGEVDHTDCEDDVYCPYCGELIELECDNPIHYAEGNHSMQCPECEKTFKVYTAVSYHYDTQREDGEE